MASTITLHLPSTPSEADEVSPSYVIPTYIQVAGALIRLALELFKRSFHPEEDRALMLGAWSVLRRSAALLLQRRAVELKLAEACEMRQALMVCHHSIERDIVFAMEFEERG